MQSRLDEAGVGFCGVLASCCPASVAGGGLRECFPAVAGRAEYLEVSVGVVGVVAGVVPVVDLEAVSCWAVVAAGLAGVVVPVEDAASGERLDVASVGPCHGVAAPLSWWLPQGVAPARECGRRFWWMGCGVHSCGLLVAALFLPTFPCVGKRKRPGRVDRSFDKNCNYSADI